MKQDLFLTGWSATAGESGSESYAHYTRALETGSANKASITWNAMDTQSVVVSLPC